MSHPYRGDDVVSDNISSENVQSLRSHLVGLGPQLELLELVDRIGGDELVEKVFGRMEPRKPGQNIVLDGSTTSGLCNACRSIFTVETHKANSWFPSLQEQTWHHSSAGDLQEAARNGCCICLVLWNRITGGRPFNGTTEFTTARPLTGLVDYTTYSVGGSIDGVDNVYTLHFVYKGHDSPFDYSICHRLRLCVIPTADLNGIVNEGTISATTGEEHTLDFFRRCLKTCFQQHERCCADSQETWRPTRLVDLGQETVRLDISSTPSKYVTLSHRWGNANIMKATKSMLAELQVGIDIGKLPRTFTEAFMVCRQLGYRYIWIDSLCILQDDDDDWRAEASLMGKNYANAELNISATAAEDSDAGLFVQRDPKLVMPIKVTISEPGSPFNPGSYHILDPQIWSAGVSEAPLNSRGWVFQERLLARRVLHFGRNQLYFECHQQDACESFPLGLPTIPTYAFRDLGAAPNGHFKSLDPVISGRRAREERRGGRQCPDESLDPYYLWAEWVETYSALQLTKATDRLIAISGLAKLLQEILSDDQYLAGLWRRHLPYHLLWSKRKHLRHGTNSLDYCAPSWSWASIKDQVDMYPVSTSSDDEVILVDIIEAEGIPAGADETGPVVGGYVTLRGPLRPARWAFYQPSEDRTSISDLVPQLTLPGSNSPAKISVWEDEWNRLPLADTLSDQNRHHDKGVFCVPVHVWWKDGDICTTGLLLESVEWNSDPSLSSQSPSLFRRVGKFKIDRADIDGHTQFYGFDRALMVNQDYGEQTPESMRAVVEAHLEWHEVTIV